jgi:tetratricopeptide (TPR) repeat protein
MKYLLVILFFIQTFSFAQENERDSLLFLLQSSKELKTKALLYTQLSKLYEHSNTDSAIYYAQEGYDISTEIKYDLGRAENAAALADFFIIKNHLDKAKTYYSIASELFLTADKLFDYTQITMIIGNINLAQNNYIEALKLYQECLDNSKENDFYQFTPHLYNNLGELYLEIEDYDDAQKYFDIAFELFKNQDDEYNAAHSLSNISNIHNKFGDEDKAIKGYLECIKGFSMNENWEDIAFTYNSISEIYLNKQEYSKAEKYINLALNTIENESGTYSGPTSFYKTKIYTTASSIFFGMDKMEKSIDYAHKSIKLSYENSYKKNISENAKILSKIYDKRNQIDSALAYNKIYIKYSEDYQREYDVKHITQLKMQYKFDEILKKKELDDIQKEEEHKRRELVYIGISIITILAVIIMILLYRNQKSKTTKILLKKENLELEREKLSQDIDYKKKELASNMMYLIEKNEFITSIATKLIDLKPASKKDNQDIIQGLINELKQNSSVKIWDEFEMRFKEVHSGFYDTLHRKFPDLSPNEIKICAFLRLNMSTKEISAITHQSIKSLNMARFRLRKKLNIDRDENLIAFLTQF